ncbi:MAG: serine hydrolase domain-containing protein [Fuerstiella sp.]
MPVQNLIQKAASSADLTYLDVSCGDGRSAQLRQVGGPSPSEDPGGPEAARRYLVASITKPIVAMAALKLAADGEFSLAERLSRFLPDFGKAAFRRITVRHLLTHTSGFPDMLPENAELRAAHASLKDFQQRAASVEPDFAPSADCRYSSVGFLLLGAVIEQVTGQHLPAFLRQTFLEPLQMNETWLGIPEDEADRLLPTVLPSILPAWQPEAHDWGWNSRYWRTLGAPWGGMISTASDLGRFASMMLAEGCSLTGQQILSAAVIREATSDQTSNMGLPPNVTGGQPRPWGFGWRRHWTAHAAVFGDFLSPETVGHWGATGTMMWMDPVAGRYAVILTTTPYEDSQAAIQRLSNIITVHAGN